MNSLSSDRIPVHGLRVVALRPSNSPTAPNAKLSYTLIIIKFTFSAEVPWSPAEMLVEWLSVLPRFGYAIAAVGDLRPPY